MAGFSGSNFFASVSLYGGAAPLIDDLFDRAKLGRSDSVSGNKMTHLSVITWPGSLSIHLAGILDYRLIGRQGDAPFDAELKLTRGPQGFQTFTTNFNLFTYLEID